MKVHIYFPVLLIIIVLLLCTKANEKETTEHDDFYDEFELKILEKAFNCGGVENDIPDEYLVNPNKSTTKKKKTTTVKSSVKPSVEEPGYPNLNVTKHPTTKVPYPDDTTPESTGIVYPSKDNTIPDTPKPSAGYPSMNPPTTKNSDYPSVNQPTTKHPGYSIETTDIAIYPPINVTNSTGRPDYPTEPTMKTPLYPEVNETTKSPQYPSLPPSTTIETTHLSSPGYPPVTNPPPNYPNPSLKTSIGQPPIYPKPPVIPPPVNPPVYPPNPNPIPPIIPPPVYPPINNGSNSTATTLYPK
jgi:hypothetical protein